MASWYTLYTKPNAEYQVATTLERRGIETYLPELETARARRPGGKQPFFPCYLFVRVDLKRVGYAQVQWTPGLRRVVAFEGQPVPLGDALVELIRRRLDGLNAGGGQLAPRFQPGQRVRITRGPLQGLLAIFEQPTSSAERVQVLLGLLGQASRAQVAESDLEQAQAGARLPAVRRPRRTRGRGRLIRRAD